MIDFNEVASDPPSVPDEAIVMAYDFAEVLRGWPRENPPMITCGICGFGKYIVGGHGVR